MYIEIEGIEGVGKSTQSDLLREWLEKQGKGAIVTKELDSTHLGRTIKGIMDAGGGENHVRTEMFLFLACKCNNFHCVIKPNINNGIIVIGDRGCGSFVSYHFDELKDSNTLFELQDLAAGEIKPDLTLLLDLPIGQTLQRIRKKKLKSKFDRMETKFLKKQKQIFLQLSQKMNNWVVIDSSPSITEVHLKIIEAVSPFIKF